MILTRPRRTRHGFYVHTKIMPFRELKEGYGGFMCFDHDSEPPIGAGDRSITTHDLTMTARDGNQFMAFEAFF